MTNFVILYTGGTMPEDEAVIAEAMAAWGWYGKMGAAVVDGGNPFSGSRWSPLTGSATGWLARRPSLATPSSPPTPWTTPWPR